MPVQHVWFDFDGTLYQETAAFKAAHDRIRYQSYADIAGLTDLAQAKQEYDALYAQHGSNSATFMALGKPKDFWPQALADLDYSAVLAPTPEITDTLQELRSIVPISIFTNNTAARATKLLQHLEIPLASFTHTLFRADFDQVKPALDGFRKMLELTDLPAENILYVGDRVDVDIKPAAQLGMQTCLLYKTAPEATYCVANFSELLSLV